MTSKEIVMRAIRFQNPPRIPYHFPKKYGSDFAFSEMSPSIDARPKNGIDEWGAVWENIGISNLGEVKLHPLENWDAIDSFPFPDITDPARWEHLKNARQQAGDKFLLGSGISLYERVHFLRGLENTWTDIFEAPEKLGRIIDKLADMNIYTIQKYAENNFDGYFWSDDWGLQDRLMISPDKWREIWKPRYKRVYQAAKCAGLATFLHSCGYIVDILDDLIEIGLDVIQMDQQENMGLDLLGNRFGGRITFWCPVDIQAVMPKTDINVIRQYCHKMLTTLGRPEGGFIAKWYEDAVAVGHKQEAIDAMCDEFLRST